MCEAYKLEVNFQKNYNKLKLKNFYQKFYR